MCSLINRSLQRQIFNKQVYLITIIFNNSCDSAIYSRSTSDKTGNSTVLVAGYHYTKMPQSKPPHCDGASPELFSGHTDRFGGITVVSNEEPCLPSQFDQKLEASLTAWKGKKVRGLWFKVALEDASWVPSLAKNEFVFHHAKPGYVMMCRWLPISELNNIPPFAHTMFGVGAIVVNSAQEILVVKEKYLPDFPHWKLPGGYVEPGENLADAALREVLEETGVKTEFEFLLTFRHMHGAMFGCSDCYFVVSLKPTSEEINMCPREIAACQWMKVDDYLNSPHTIETNKFFVKKYLECQKSGTGITYESSVHPFLKRRVCIYSISSGQEHSLSEKNNS
uniref:Nudix hydrolase domain-containing protein n=1 Tax=Timema poppense TaxID=170557 RepID=A0A7R9H5E1_TIMPO|nr:unnamed protein product [Timema poppensis]